MNRQKLLDVLSLWNRSLGEEIYARDAYRDARIALKKARGEYIIARAATHWHGARADALANGEDLDPVLVHDADLG